MIWPPRTGAVLAGASLLASLLSLCGCATPGPPQPPSLRLPGLVSDLAAVRTGNAVALIWTMPKRDTERQALTRPVPVHICRSEGVGLCTAIADVTADPGASASFSEALPPVLTAGAPRPLRYFIELRNHARRSAGFSNSAIVLAGQAPPPVAGLAADVRKSGIALHWQQADPAVSIRLHRVLVTPAAHQKPESRAGLLDAEPEPAQQTLLVADDPGRALDHSITFGSAYEYRAQRVARIQSEGQTVELAGELSGPVRVQAVDTFPPAVPTGLVAVAVTPEPGQPGSLAIDLSWQPSPDADTAGYIVYRRQGDAAWQRTSGDQPISAPSFHDAAVQPGQSYAYAVSAVDRIGNQSARSEEARETVPQP